MSDQHTPTPNSYLGEVHWYACAFYGTLEFVCQDWLGMMPKEPIPNNKFLDTTAHSIDHLRDLFDEQESNGKLVLILNTSDMMGSPLAWIETKFGFYHEVTDEEFVHLINDFVTYARCRPMVDSSKREGAEITDEDIEQITMRESLEEHDFWNSLPTVIETEHGMPHYLWVESLDHQTKK